MGSWRSIKGTLLCECAHTPIPRHTHSNWIMERDRKGSFSHTRTRARAPLSHTSSVEALRSANRLTNCGWKWVGHSCWSKRVFLSSTLNSGLITMGAVWTARLLCLFLLLLNTRQSAALPHNTGKRLLFFVTADALHTQFPFASFCDLFTFPCFDTLFLYNRDGHDIKHVTCTYLL